MNTGPWIVDRAHWRVACGGASARSAARQPRHRHAGLPRRRGRCRAASRKPAAVRGRVPAHEPRARNGRPRCAQQADVRPTAHQGRGQPELPGHHHREPGANRCRTRDPHPHLLQQQLHNAPRAFPTKRADASLNLSTYIALYSYGYRNVYELGPLLDPADIRCSSSSPRRRTCARPPLIGLSRERQPVAQRAAAGRSFGFDRPPPAGRAGSPAIRRSRCSPGTPPAARSRRPRPRPPCAAGGPIATMVRAIAASSASSGRPRTKLWSILSLSIGKLLEVGQARIAGAEIVERQQARPAP